MYMAQISSIPITGPSFGNRLTRGVHISVSDLPYFLTTALCSFKSGRSCIAIIGRGPRAFGVDLQVTSPWKA